MVVSELHGLLCDQVRVQRVREAGEGGVTHLSGIVGTSWLACGAAHRQEAWEAAVSTQQRLSGRRKGHTNTTPRTPMDAHSRARTCTCAAQGRRGRYNANNPTHGGCTAAPHLNTDGVHEDDVGVVADHGAGDAGDQEDGEQQEALADLQRAVHQRRRKEPGHARVLQRDAQPEGAHDGNDDTGWRKETTVGTRVQRVGACERSTGSQRGV